MAASFEPQEGCPKVWVSPYLKQYQPSLPLISTGATHQELAKRTSPKPLGRRILIPDPNYNLKKSTT